MNRLWAALLSLLLLIGGLVRAAAPPFEDLSKKPITTDRGELGELLRGWYRAGTAAGNVGDWYDNRDAAHSELDRSPYPQLRKVFYSDDDIKSRRHWAFMPRTRPHVTFGNSSTSAPPERHGSNPRIAYSASRGLEILERQYLGNNLYIYPEHRDHDPGHNGVGDGYGDLYPTNSPYLLISQGSSGSDQPFMRAVPFTLAAFRPEVKKKLVESGLLMPTVQMIFRRCNQHLKAPREYLSGKAHPSAFEGSHVDATKMVRLAHDIRTDNIPPLVKLKVIEEDKPEVGRDFFEPAGFTEQHADTACVIARVWRGVALKRRLVVSAEDSIDLNKNKLTFTWVVLRGDEKRITITPRDKKGRSAEITVAYHERRPIAPGAKMESNRVDIGVFAHNGSYYSAPSFITFHSLDSEARSYDDKGRIVEVGYGMGKAELRIADPGKLLAALGQEGLAATVLGLTAAQRKELAARAKSVAEMHDELARSRKSLRETEAERNKAAAELRKAEEALAKAKKENKGEDEVARAQQEVKAAKEQLAAHEQQLKASSDRLKRLEPIFTETLDRRREPLKAGVRGFVQQALEKAARTPTLWNDHLKALRQRNIDDVQRQERVDVARRKLLQLGVIVNGNKKSMVFRPARPGAGKEVERLSGFERTMIEEFNAVLLAELVFPDVLTHTFRPNFVDGRLTTPKSWRDVYQYDGDRLVGWTRYPTGPTNFVHEFTPEGWLVTAKDDRGRPTKARTVVYKQDRQTQPTGWMNTNPLRQVNGDEVITFRYDGEKRQVEGREKVQESK